VRFALSTISLYHSLKSSAFFMSGSGNGEEDI
jgi:hypothetical protein